MRNIIVKKIKFFATEKGWGGNTCSSYYAVRINHFTHKVEWEDLGGAAPSFQAFLSFCLSDKDMAKEIKWALTEYRRKYPVFLRESFRDISLYVSKAQHEWAFDIAQTRVLSLHISNFGRMNRGIPDFFIGDFVDILGHFNPDFLSRIGNVKKYYKYLKPNYPGKQIDSICGTRGTL